MAMVKNVEAFVIHIILFISKMIIYPTPTAQIALLIAKKVIVSAKYTNFAYVFSKQLIKILLK